MSAVRHTSAERGRARGHSAAQEVRILLTRRYALKEQCRTTSYINDNAVLSLT